jgi:hypothetical protein
MRAQKFGVELSVDAKKEARAARFGISAPINMINTAVSVKCCLNSMCGNIIYMQKNAGLNFSGIFRKSKMWHTCMVLFTKSGN